MKTGIAGRIAQAFIDSKITPLLMIGALLLGLYSTYLTPREEEPQIIVPMVDIMVPYPGNSAKEVEERVTIPLEKIIHEIHGVEYIYSMSRPDFSLITVRYYVGEDLEKSLVKLWASLMRHMDEMPPGVRLPLIKNRSIDDVPVFGITLWSKNYDGYMLRRIANQLSQEIQNVKDVAEVKVTGGQKRQVRVLLDPAKIRSYGLTLPEVAGQLQSVNQKMLSGEYPERNREFLVRSGNFLKNADEVARLVVGVHQGKPVYLREIAVIKDGPEEISNYVFIGMGPAARHSKQGEKFAGTGEYPAVTISIAKRKGADALRVTQAVMKKVKGLRGTLIPGDVHLTETRNYGKTASDKVSTLLEHLLVAVVAVTLLVGLFLGWRGGLVVFASVPITFALTLFVYYVLGYTLNRVTLFALIFVTGIVVDDSIIIAENVHRHFSMKQLPPLQAAIAAISEVGNPTILATFTVIASVLPMVFVSGLMGPYMSPMPIGASLATLFSLMVALIGTPWLAYRLLKNGKEEEEYDLRKTFIYKFYRKSLQPILENSKKTWIILGVTAVLLLISIAAFPLKLVEVKMLPFDNKSEFQVIIDTPEGSTLEHTARIAKEIAGYLRTVPEVENYEYYVGVNAPINFNGLVRHYYLRRGANVADIQVNLVDKSERSTKSHAIAERVRPAIQKIAQKYGSRVKVVEIPPGPPVLSTLVAEIYGPDYRQQIQLARKVRRIFEETKGVVDVDWLVEDDQTVYDVNVDPEKAALKGLDVAQAATTLRMALSGANIGLLHEDRELEAVPIQVRLGKQYRGSIQRLSHVYLRSRTGQLIPLTDIVTIHKRIENKSIYRKNLKRVVYVTGDVAKQIESPIYAMLEMNKKIEQIDLPGGAHIEPLYSHQPFMEENLSLKWDGEWQITYEVFRDLGTAFAVVLIIIYMLIIGWFQSFKTPLVMMIAIPLSLVGIVPGHLAHRAFFTATSMIGMIALAGIMVRNSVLLIDFIELRRDEGVNIIQAIIESGAVRTRPILLTAGTVVIGATIILFDPIFQGLAISLMWGAVASTLLTLGVVPLVYYLVERKKATN